MSYKSMGCFLIRRSAQWLCQANKKTASPREYSNAGAVPARLAAGILSRAFFWGGFMGKCQIATDISWVYKPSITTPDGIIIGVRDLFGDNRITTVVGASGSLLVCAYAVVNAIGDAGKYGSAEHEIAIRWPDARLAKFQPGSHLGSSACESPLIPAWQALIAWHEYARALAGGQLMVQQIARVLHNGKKMHHREILKALGGSPIIDECLENTLRDMVGAGLLEKDWEYNYWRPTT